MNRPVVLVVLVVLAVSSECRGDVVRLKDAGEVRGTIVSRPRSETVQVRTLAGVTIGVSADDVTAIVKRPIEAEIYVEKAREVADHVDARWELGEWCRSHQLTSQRREQMREIVRLDPSHAEARRVLGYVLRDGRWLSKDAAMLADGFVRIGRRWVTPVEAALMAEIDSSSEKAKAWFPKAVALKKRLPGLNPGDRREILDAIAMVDDPHAVAAWVKTFSEHPDMAVRTAYVVALGRIGSVPTVRPLAAMAVEDGDASVRRTATEAIPLRHRDIAAEILGRWLSDENNVYVRSSARALESLGSDVATPQLIRALVTAHWRTIKTVDMTPGFTAAGGDIGYGSQPLLPPEVEIGLRTGQYPFGVNVEPPANRIRIKRVRVEVKNEEVLRALMATTGQNFGFDERQWYAWWRRTKS